MVNLDRQSEVNMMKKIPVGIENFEEFSSENFYYVDKTMFIAELLRNWGKVNLFTRPRRFGKSLNMSMLRCFFEIGCDKSLFEGLKISREQQLCERYMGKFPVIFVSLKNVDGMDERSARAALCRVIGNEARRFGYLSESDRLDANDKEMYRALTLVKDGMFSMADDLLVDSLRTLSVLLAKHYGEKVILLIDEYDVPLDRAFQAGYYDEMIFLIRNLFSSVLKTNDALLFAVLTGCLRISKESIFTGLNNLKVHTVTDTRYDEYFGFTDEEVREILEYYGLQGRADDIRDWYDGYRFGSASIYCPWDVLNYCDALLDDPEALPENYWANTSGNAIVRRFIGRAGKGTKDEIEQLIAGETITEKIKPELTYSEMESSVENLWSVLFSTGYLTWRRQSGRGIYDLVIPNREIRELFIEQIRQWFSESLQEDTGKNDAFCRAFIEGRADLVEKILREYLWDTISIRDYGVRNTQKENFYHGLLLGLLHYRENWLVRSNEESGRGYCDISVRTPEGIGVAVELKYAENGNMVQECDAALLQIETRGYDAALYRDGMKKVLKYGIAFYKKTCKVVGGFSDALKS